MSTTHLDFFIHSNIIHNSQDREPAKVSISGWIKKMWYIHNGILFHLLKGYSVIRFNMDKPGRNDVK
jgi:hypothetical protein